MQTEPVVLPVVAGALVITVPPLGRPTVTVDGTEAPRLGSRIFELPGVDGVPIRAKVLPDPLAAFPRVEINGTRYPTGPATPLVLRILTIVPLLMVIFGGAVGALCGMAGSLVNAAVSRLRIGAAPRGLIMVLVTVATFLTWLLVVAAIAR